MKIKFAILCATILAVFFGYKWYSNRQTEKFVREQISNFSGYRFEYFKDDKLVFLHLPNGTRKGLNLASLRFVHLFKPRSADSKNGEIYYVWRFASDTEGLFVPYFSISPETILQTLKSEHPEFDSRWVLEKTKEFERNEFDYCTIWREKGRDTPLETGYNEYGLKYCNR